MSSEGPRLLEEDPEDWKIMLREVIVQAVEDYIKLQHPKIRSKNLNQEAFETAVDFFFDEEYELEHIRDYNDAPMKLADIVHSLYDVEDMNIDKLQKRLIATARSFWESKRIHSVFVPEQLTLLGEVWDVRHDDTKLSPEIGWSSREVRLHTKSPTASEGIVEAMMRIVVSRQELDLSPKQVKELGAAWFHVLKTNDALRAHRRTARRPPAGADMSKLFGDDDEEEED